MSQGLYNTSLDQTIQEKEYPSHAIIRANDGHDTILQWNEKLLHAISICIDILNSYFCKISRFDMFFPLTTKWN